MGQRSGGQVWREAPPGETGRKGQEWTIGNSEQSAFTSAVLSPRAGLQINSNTSAVRHWARRVGQ